jgi:asparagine synthase (glutamine-hydrolysing)
MCGIAGQVGLAGGVEPASVGRMIAGIRHRGPDDEGIWTSADGRCAFGHARLSIIDLSPSGHQPMIDPDTGAVVVFNGEIYNFQELRAECVRAGDRFVSHSDTEVILALYRRHGIELLAKLRGMFAFAIWDPRRRRLFAARDRVGKKPFNYAVVDGGLVFCSELAPLSRHPWASSEMDDQALELYLQLQYIPAPWTIHRGIRKLPPAHFLMLDESGLKIEKYWEVDYRNKVALSEADAVDALEEKLTEAVSLRLISDVPLGALLSGGVDSSVIVALMSKLSDDPVRTFSIGFEDEAFNELPYARQAAELHGTRHHPEVLSGDVAPLLPALVRHYGEPYADSSAVPSFLVSAAARKHVTVVLNGDGGDELLGGYPRYARGPAQRILSRLAADVLSPAQTVALAARLAPGRGLSGRVARKIGVGILWPEMRSLNMYSAAFWDDAARAELLGRAHDPDLLPTWRRDWLTLAREHASDPVDRMLWYDNHTYLPGDLLAKMDIASMHCGLETRSPLLDHRLIEFCAGLDVSLKVRGGTGKYLLKKLAERHFPPEFVHRKKMGFGIPLAGWLAGPLRALTTDVLSDRNAMSPLEPAVVDRTLAAFLAGRAEHASRIWTLLMYGLWRRGGATPE